jgi:hypothetical protein
MLKQFVRFSSLTLKGTNIRERLSLQFRAELRRFVCLRPQGIGVFARVALFPSAALRIAL